MATNQCTPSELRALRWRPESLVVLADAMGRAEQMSGSEVRYAVTCSSEEELEHLADALSVEVQTQGGATLAVRRTLSGGDLIVATFKPGAGPSGDSRDAPPAPRRSGWPLAMVMREVRQALRDQQAGVHWSHGLCWCDAFHADEAATGLQMVLPPWDDASRELESARAEGGRP